MSEKQAKRLRRELRAAGVPTPRRGTFRALARARRRDPEGFNAAIAAANLRRADFVSKARRATDRQAREMVKAVRKQDAVIADGFAEWLRMMGKNV